MRYSLVSRFRGCLLGAIIADSRELSPATKSHTENTRRFHDLYWEKIAFLGTDSLIELGTLDLDDWYKRAPKDLLDRNLEKRITPKAIIAALPVILFFHDNKAKLRKNLRSLATLWGDNPTITDGVLAVGYAIAQSLTEKLEPTDLIPQIVSFLGETSTTLPKQLSSVYTLIQQGVCFDFAIANLSKEDRDSNTIAIAFYCFLSTLEDFRLSVLRSVRKDDGSQGLSAIVGALSGSYNSTVGIPISWQLSNAESSASGITSLTKVLKSVDALSAVWSGVYNLTSKKSEEWQKLSAVAAPRVIRLR